MKLIKQYHEFITPLNKESREIILKQLELAGRICYKSEDKITEDSASKFVSMIKGRNHQSVLEHINITIKFVTNRGVTHELVRHRLASYSQESTRFCSYNKDKFGKELTFIIPVWIKEDLDEFYRMLHAVEINYFYLLKKGWKPQQAREILPNALKTEIIITCNLREWYHVLKLRTSKAAHPQIRELIIPVLKEFQEYLPEIFGDLKY